MTEGRLKRYRQQVKKYSQSGTFQNNQRKFYPQLGGNDTKTYQQPDIRKTDFGLKYGNQKTQRKRSNG